MIYDHIPDFLYNLILNDQLPKELRKKYFDFKSHQISDKKFCEDLLKQLKLSYNNCNYYQEKLCKKFDYTLPEDLTIGNLEKIPYIPSNDYKKSVSRNLELLKASLDEIVLFSCSSSTTGITSIIPRTLEDFDQIQYNAVKTYSEFFNWKEIKPEPYKRAIIFNFSPDRFFLSIMTKKNSKGFEYVDKTRYFSSCINKPFEYYAHVEYMIKINLLVSIRTFLSTLSVRGGFVMDVSKMLKIIKKVLKTGKWEKRGVNKILFNGNPALMNYMFENRLLRENIFFDLDEISYVGCSGGGWDGVKGEVKLDAVNKTRFIENYEKIFNIRSKNIRDIYSLAEVPTIFGGHWSEKYQDFLFHCPDTTRIIVRDLDKLEPVNEGEEGLLEVITPYGVNGSINQALLVDDIVEIISKKKCPECGYQGAVFRIIGRLENAQGKCCSSLINWSY
ncbi:MAG: hypothetical protein EU529_00190 [Promethearchaeota archaeon]|nr:MAG: hypothetical protein EU529_00190 [Candidatus Lokiarchaeota archaeon]